MTTRVRLFIQYGMKMNYILNAKLSISKYPRLSVLILELHTVNWTEKIFFTCRTYTNNLVLSLCFSFHMLFSKLFSN